MIVVSAGTSSISQDSGLTVIDTEDPGSSSSDILPAIGSTALYPLDPDDMVKGVRVRYRPRSVAVVYGR